MEKIGAVQGRSRSHAGRRHSHDTQYGPGSPDIFPADAQEKVSPDWTMNAVERLNVVRGNIKRHLKAFDEIKALIIELGPALEKYPADLDNQSPDASQGQQEKLQTV